MIISNISLGNNVYIEKTSSINNVCIGDDAKVCGDAKIFGSADNVLQIGKSCYIGISSIIEGFNAKVTIGNYVSIAQNVHIFSGSGPNASDILQKVFPITKGEIKIGDHSWIGSGAIIMPKSVIGKFCVVAANSLVNSSFPSYSVIGGSPAKKLRSLSSEEIKKLESND